MSYLIYDLKGEERIENLVNFPNELYVKGKNFLDTKGFTNQRRIAFRSPNGKYIQFRTDGSIIQVDDSINLSVIKGLIDNVGAKYYQDDRKILHHI